MPTVWGGYQKGKQKLLKEDQEMCYTALVIGLSYLKCFRFQRAYKFFLEGL